MPLAIVNLLFALTALGFACDGQFRGIVVTLAVSLAFNGWTLWRGRRA